MQLSSSQRGDTIIEVILAFAVFSLLSVVAMVVMGQGTNAAQRALEITHVRSQIDAQAEALRASQKAFTATVDGGFSWPQIAVAGSANNTDVYSDDSKCPTAMGSGWFLMDARTGQKVTGSSWFKDINAATAPPYSQVIYSPTNPTEAYGIWVERRFVDGGDAPDSYNFTINACWYGAGQNVPVHLDTIVRLYDPGS